MEAGCCAGTCCSRQTTVEGLLLPPYEELRGRNCWGVRGIQSFQVRYVRSEERLSQGWDYKDMLRGSSCMRLSHAYNRVHVYIHVRVHAQRLVHYRMH